MESPALPPTDRFRQIDILRAVAALSVLWAHAAEQYTAPSGAWDLLKSVPHALNLGRIGVLVFFCVSGFVISGSLNSPKATTGRFVRHRFFRLYPVYWIALAAGLFFFWPIPTLTPALVLANILMLPSLFGQQEVLGIFWTLETELAFYLLCWVLFRLGWLRRPSVLFALAALLIPAWIFLDETCKHGLALPGLYRKLPQNLSIMLWGALFRLAYRDRCLAPMTAVLGLLCVAPPLATLARSHATEEIAYPIAVALFAAGATSTWLKNRPLEYLGQISYSIYLFHPFSIALVFALVARYGSGGIGLPLYLTLTALGTSLWAAAMYRWIEAPAIRLAHARG